MKKYIRKVISVILTVIIVVSMFAVGSSAASSLDVLDLAFVIDTTGSMADDIEQVQINMENHLNALEDSGADFRIAIVDYRDFAERTGDYNDYPYCVQLDFTDNYETILNAIYSLDLGYGGDDDETVCSALIDGLSELSWRKSAGKAAILMGDAAALDPEPFTGYTVDDAANFLYFNNIDYKEEMRSLSRAVSAEIGGPVTLFTIATSEDSIADFEYLARETGGKSYVALESEEIPEIIDDIIEELPEVIEDEETSFFDILWDILSFLLSLLTFQWI